MLNKKLLLGIFLLLIVFQSFAQNEYVETKTEAPYFKSLKSDSQIAELPLKSTDVKVNISGIIANVTIEQTYKNEGKNPIEAVYVFPMSDKAAIYSMEMIVGNRTIIAKIKEKNQARTEYEAAKANGNRTSLLEQERPNVFTMNVANINSGEEIKVKLQYTEFIIPDEGLYSFVFPTVVGPRYNTKSGVKFASTPYSKKGIKPFSTFNLGLELNSTVPITSVNCLTHKVYIDQYSDKNAILNLSNDEIYANNKDFVLNYTLKGNTIESGVQLFNDGKEQFFLAMVQPPKKIKENEIPPREYIFVVDISGSMHGFPLDVSKKLLKNLISNLKKSDQFNVVLFSGSSQKLSENSLPATNENIQKAIYLIDNQLGGGSTEILGALKTALSLPRPSKSLSRSVVIVTDGYVSVEKEAFDLIKANLNNLNVFAFGIGSSVNRYLINGLAHVGGGEPFVVLDQSKADSTATKFRNYIQTPVLSNIKIKFNGFEAYDLIYEKLPDLMAERPLIIAGKYRNNPNGSIAVSGYTGKGKFEETIQVNQEQLSDNHSALKYLWAREKIKLLDDYSSVYQSEQNTKAITQLGLSYNLMTAYTSFIAIDTKEVIDNKGKLNTVQQVLPLPEGVSNLAVGADFDLVDSFIATSDHFNRIWGIIGGFAIVIFGLLFFRKSLI